MTGLITENSHTATKLVCVEVVPFFLFLFSFFSFFHFSFFFFFFFIANIILFFQKEKKVGVGGKNVNDSCFVMIHVLSTSAFRSLCVKSLDVKDFKIHNSKRIKFLHVSWFG